MNPHVHHTERSAAARRVEDWARELAGLELVARVTVTERPCSRSGWPPFEVAIAHELAGVRHEHTIHKRLESITRLDVEGAWRSGDACCDP